MRITRKTKNTLKTILGVVLIIGAVLGIGALINSIVNKTDDGLVEISPKFEVGGLTSTGKYEETKLSLYTKESFECQGLKISLDFDSNVQYQVFYYSDTDNFISSSEVFEEGQTMVLPNGAMKARIELTPIWDDEVEEKDKELGFFDVRKYAKQLTIEVNDSQKIYSLSYEKVSLTDSVFVSFPNTVGSVSGDLNEISTYKSYVFTASEKCMIYYETELTSNYQISGLIDETSFRYQTANGDEMHVGIKNAFELNEGDTFIISMLNATSEDNFTFYIGTYVLK